MGAKEDVWECRDAAIEPIVRGVDAMYILFLFSLTLLFTSSCIWAVYIAHVSHFGGI
jgi:hypothetical protein